MTIAKRMLLYNIVLRKEMWEWRKRYEEEEEGQSLGGSK